MSSIYILSDYGKLSKKDETIVFTQPDGTSTILFPFKTELLVLIGTVSISGEAMRILTKYKIPVTFLSKNGRFNGRLTFGEAKNVFLRKRQYEILSDSKRSLAIARSIVTGKIKNQISFMQRIKRKTSLTTEEELKIQNALNLIKNTLDKSEGADSVDRLRGYEGNASRFYFSVFEINIIPEWADFKKRSKNPPTTNVNAVLSFLYTLLMYRIEAAITSVGLDTCCGNLHALNYGKTALVYDLIEEFRVPVADSVCCSLFNLGILTANDFEEKQFSADSEDFPLEEEQISESSDGEVDIAFGKGILLVKGGIKKVIKAFEEKLSCTLQKIQN